ncbi:MAG TPA: hypothetical protein VER32_12770 [Pyrinomonadaceae bacterium]|nr:hypothetical protein [Pyrinomonadaceae bacterium]
MSLTPRKRSLSCLVALLVASAAGAAQTESPPDGRARLHENALDRYGDIPCEDLLARLDHLAIRLTNEPDAEAHLIVYGGRLGAERRVRAHIEFTRDYLMTQRGIAARRVRVEYGGRREEFTVEPYVVPKGATPPGPLPTIGEDDAATRAVKFDEGRLGVGRDARGRLTLRRDEAMRCPSGSSPDLAAYAQALRADRDAGAYVVVYGARGARLSEANAVSRLVRHRLFTAEDIAQRRITAVYGGTREEPFVELWLVPRGATPPAARRR